MSFWNKTYQYYNVFKGLTNYLINDRKIPIFIGWALTYSCNKNCEYCGIKSLDDKELSFSEISHIIDELSEMGCARINFTGGEPLLRKDLLYILRYAKKKRIFATLSTNGSIFDKDIFAEADEISVSIDEYEKTGENIYSIDRIVKSMYKKKIILSTVIHNKNIKNIGALVDYAKENKVKIKFQPVAEIPLKKVNINDLIPDRIEFVKIIKHLLMLKKGESPIYNSRAELIEMMKFPNIPSKPCAAGKIFFRIDPIGRISSCFRQKNENSMKILEYSLKNCLEKIEYPECDACMISNGIRLGKILVLDRHILLEELRRFF